jgi:phosphate transport system permease protein
VGPRKIRRTPAFGVDDWLSLGGAVVAAYALVEVGYNHIFDFSGLFGFGICWYLVFLAVYAGVVAAAHPRTMVVERLVSATLYLVAAAVMFALGTTVVYIFTQGYHAYIHIGFFTHDMAGVSPTAPLTQGGILHAIIGTVIEVGIAVVVSVPLGIGTAVYMTEVGGRGSQLVRTVVESMTALPEILAGLFVYAMLIVGLGMPKSGLAVSIAMAVTMVPIIARAGEVALRVVPGGLREAASALGSNHWRTVVKVVLPSARAGLATATILAVARGVGETAIPLITSGASSFKTLNPVGEPMNSLPLFIYTAYTTHEPAAITRGFGAASVLLAMVLALFVVIRLLVRHRGVQR